MVGWMLGDFPPCCSWCESQPMFFGMDLACWFSLFCVCIFSEFTSCCRHGALAAPVLIFMAYCVPCTFFRRRSRTAVGVVKKGYLCCFVLTHFVLFFHLNRTCFSSLVVCGHPHVCFPTLTNLECFRTFFNFDGIRSNGPVSDVDYCSLCVEMAPYHLVLHCCCTSVHASPGKMSVVLLHPSARAVEDLV